MVITVECPSCASSFPVDPEKIPEGGVNARCTDCSEVFRVERPSTVDEPDPAETLAEGPADGSIAEAEDGTPESEPQGSETEASEEVEGEDRTDHQVAEAAPGDTSLATEPPTDEVSQAQPDASAEVGGTHASDASSGVTHEEDVEDVAEEWDITPPDDDLHTEAAADDDAATDDDPAPAEDDWVVEREPDGFMGTGPDSDPFGTSSESETPSRHEVDEASTVAGADSDFDIEAQSLEGDSLTDDPFAIGGSPAALDEPDVDEEDAGAEEEESTFDYDGGMDPFGVADEDQEEGDEDEEDDGLSGFTLTSDEPVEEERTEEPTEPHDALDDDLDGAEADEAAFGSMGATTEEAAESSMEAAAPTVDPAGGTELPGGTVPEAPTDGTVPETLEEPDEPVKAFSFGKRDPADKARRLARVLVSDMIMYNPERHQRALENDTLAADFEEEIKKSWKEYVEQVGEEMARETNYWTEALNDLLAKGERVF